jgi:hypothetical protein
MNDPAAPMYDGLCHYLYRHGGKIYSWGQEFNSVEAAGRHVNKNFKVNWVIEVHTPHVPKPLVVNGESFHM